MTKFTAFALALLTALAIGACGGSAPHKLDPSCPALMAAVPRTAPASYDSALSAINGLGQAAPSAGYSAALRPLVTAMIAAVGAIGKAYIGISQPNGDQLAAYYAARSKLQAYCS